MFRGWSVLQPADEALVRRAAPNAGRGHAYLIIPGSALVGAFFRVCLEVPVAKI